jgi:hypothetical protein
MLRGVTDIAAGGTTTVAVKSDGTVRVWGSTASGQGDVPPFLAPVHSVAVGWFHVVAMVDPSTCTGDLDRNGTIGGGDLGLMLGSWGTVPNYPFPADLSGNGIVDGADVGLLLGNWGPCPG